MGDSVRSVVTNNRHGLTAVGIDVGGARKGFHAVALSDGQYVTHCGTNDADKLAQWCRETVRANVIAVDAPCRWSADGRARPAERQLMERGIWCFSTPTRQRALEHPLNHYGWMLSGAQIFDALEATHPLCCAIPSANGHSYCFETFPHAITWHLMDGKANARKKRAERRALLAAAGIALTRLTNIDLIDAALCALVAHHAASGLPCIGYGEPHTGMIFVPKGPIP